MIIKLAFAWQDQHLKLSYTTLNVYSPIRITMNKELNTLVELSAARSREDQQVACSAVRTVYSLHCSNNNYYQSGSNNDRPT